MTAEDIDAKGMTEHLILLLIGLLEVSEELSHGGDCFLAAVKLAMEWNE